METTMHLNLIPMTIVAVGLSSAAFAHALLTTAAPPVGSTVKAAPKEIALDYSESVEPRFSAIQVQDTSGARVDTGDVHAASGNDKRLMVSLKSLKAGAYKVTWHVTSTDTHKTEGSYSFTVSP
jgi:hypothetical protein